MNHQSIPALTELGLSEKEAMLYTAALRRGAATAQVLALESGLKRATVYGCIESLIEKGLLHIEVSGVRKLFIAESPEKLAALLERKKQILTNVMPQLVQDYLQRSSNDNSIKMYQGLSGIKLVYDNLLIDLQQGEDYLVISDQKKWYDLDPVYFEAFIQKRANYRLNTKLILQDNSHAKQFQKKQNDYREIIKLLPKEVNLNINMVIVGNKTIITQTVEPLLAILIVNTNVAAMNRILFNTIWALI